MAFFSKSDRIAILTLAVLILSGWGVRFILHYREKQESVTLIHNAVAVPESLLPSSAVETGNDSLTLIININRADKAELESLSMIGPSKAAAIIAYRKQHGTFTCIEDIMRVKGIGPATFEAVRDYITVTTDSTAISP